MQPTVTVVCVFPDWQTAALYFWSRVWLLNLTPWKTRHCVLPEQLSCRCCGQRAPPQSPHLNSTPRVSVYATVPECSDAMKKICSSKRAELAHAMLVSNANRTEIELPHVDVCISHACCRQSPPAGGPMCFVIKSEQSLCGVRDVFVKIRH